MTVVPPTKAASSPSELKANLENGVLWLTINRADKGNAIPYYVRDRLTRSATRTGISGCARSC